jgi:hypothetical protein
MALKPVITAEEHGKMSDPLKSEYKEVEGVEGLVLDVTPTAIGEANWELANVAGLKSALSSERTKAETAAKSLKRFKDIDPDAARDALVKVAEMDDWDKDEKLQQLEKQLKDKYAAQNTAIEAKMTNAAKQHAEAIAALEGQLEKALVDSEITRAVTEHDGVVPLLMGAIKEQTRLRRDDDGKYHVEVVSSDGTVRLSSKGVSTNPMTISELVESMKADDVYGRAFNLKKSGGGSQGSAGSHTSTGKGVVLSQADATDPAKYRAAKEEASKAGVPLLVE